MLLLAYNIGLRLLVLRWSWWAIKTYKKYGNHWRCTMIGHWHRILLYGFKVKIWDLSSYPYRIHFEIYIQWSVFININTKETRDELRTYTNDSWLAGWLDGWMVGWSRPIHFFLRFTKFIIQNLIAIEREHKRRATEDCYGILIFNSSHLSTIHTQPTLVLFIWKTMGKLV